MTKPDLDTAEAFIEKFIHKDYELNIANYKLRDSAKLIEMLKSFAEEFYEFPVDLDIRRPNKPSERWYRESEEDIALTSARPLFKIEEFEDDGRTVFAAYTGSIDRSSSTYFEIYIFHEVDSKYKIFSIYVPDDEGSYVHYQGGAFSFSKARYVGVKKFKPPTDEADLIDYNTDPV